MAGWQSNGDQLRIFDVRRNLATWTFSVLACIRKRASECGGGSRGGSEQLVRQVLKIMDSAFRVLASATAQCSSVAARLSLHSCGEARARS